MKCYVHPDVDAIAICTTCGKAICDDCTINLRGKLVCRQCLSAGVGATTAELNPNTAFLIEFVGGFFGLLGIGYMYAGRVNDGVLRLVGWLIYNVVAYIVIVVLIAVLVGIVCIPFQLAIQVGVPLWSANALKNDLIGYS